MDRRKFLIKSGAASSLSFLGSAGLLSALASKGSKVSASDSSEYKALVCVFFFGGQDSYDTVLPYDPRSYGELVSVREGLFEDYSNLEGGSTRDRDRLLPLDPVNASEFGGNQFALPESLRSLKQLFDDGDAAIISNVGPLVEPIDVHDLKSDLKERPQYLFSHNDQQSTWMSSAPEGQIFGWGGLFSDQFVQPNTVSKFGAMSISGKTVFLAGKNTQQFNLGASGVIPVDKLFRGLTSSSLPFNVANREILYSHYKALGISPANLLVQDIANFSANAFERNQIYASAIESAPPLPVSMPETQFGNRLARVAESISIRSSFDVNRQIFFVGLGGFDTHSDQAANLNELQQDYSSVIFSFYKNIKQLGLQQDVTLFTASDFGRALINNGNGTDHGWGAHHFVVGGAVNGNRIYGQMPPVVTGHSLDAGNGRLIPSLSVEQYAATLGRWYGLKDNQLLSALPVLRNFDTKDIGFMSNV